MRRLATWRAWLTVGAIYASAMLSIPAPARGRLLPIDLTTFIKHAPCGIVGEVKAVEVIHDDSFPLFQRRVDFSVLRHFGSGPCSVEGSAVLWLLSDVHGSDAKVGDKAIFFPRMLRGRLVDAEPGRSFWKLSEVDGRLTVTIDQGLDFVLAPWELGDGEEATLPLSAVVRLWRKKAELNPGGGVGSPTPSPPPSGSGGHSSGAQ